jgi:hypothetical protein
MAVKVISVTQAYWSGMVEKAEVRLTHLVVLAELLLEHLEQMGTQVPAAIKVVM